MNICLAINGDSNFFFTDLSILQTALSSRGEQSQYCFDVLLCFPPVPNIYVWTMHVLYEIAKALISSLYRPLNKNSCTISTFYSFRSYSHLSQPSRSITILLSSCFPLGPFSSFLCLLKLRQRHQIYIGPKWVDSSIISKLRAIDDTPKILDTS